MDKMSLKKATLISLVSKYTTVLCGLVFTAILARLLTPDDYGVVAVVNVFVIFFSMISDMGFSAAIIQNKTLTAEDDNQIFTFTIYAGLLFMLVFSLLAWPIAYIYKSNDYLDICPILSISVLFNTLNIVPRSKLLKDKRFFAISVRNVTAAVVSSIIAIIMALCGFKYYALIAQSIMSAVFEFIWNIVTARLRFMIKFNFDSIRKILGFGKYELGFNFINYFVRNLDNLLIGAVMGERALGYYEKAYKLMVYPTQYLTHAITPVFQPVFSEYSEQKERIYMQYTRVLSILSLLAIFIAVFCFFSAREIILIMMGDQWVDSIFCFKVLSVSMWAQMLYASAGAIYLALGDAKLRFKIGAAEAILMVALILTGIATKRIEAVSILVSAGLILRFFISFYPLITKCFGIRFIDFMRLFNADFLIAIICIACILCTTFFDNTGGVIVSAIIKFAACSVGYCIGLIVTKRYRVFLLLLKKQA